MKMILVVTGLLVLSGCVFGPRVQSPGDSNISPVVSGTATVPFFPR